MIDFDPRKIKSFRNQTDNIYITQLRDKSDKSFSLSYKKRRDEEMFSKVSQIPLFAEFKQDYEDQEKTRSFLSKYLNAQTHYLDLDSFIQKLENLDNILNPVEKYKTQKDLKFEGFGGDDIYIYILFSIFGKILSVVKTFEASDSEKSDLDQSIIK